MVGAASAAAQTGSATLVAEGTVEDFRVSGTTIPDAEAFVKAFRAAVADQSCFKVSALTNFPVRVNTGRLRGARTRFLHNRTVLCRYFRRIFTDETRRIVLTSPLAPVGSQGLMFGDGMIWIASINGKLGFNSANLNEP